jgi:hypothetical protein
MLRRLALRNGKSFIAFALEPLNPRILESFIEEL